MGKKMCGNRMDAVGYLNTLEVGSRVERDIASTLLSSLNAPTLKGFISSCNNPFVSKLASECLKRRCRHDEDLPIGHLLALYMDKDGGKVCFAKGELMRRYPFQSMRDKRRILAAFISSCKSDRAWAARRYSGREGTDIFELLVCSFEERKEKEPARAVIKHHPDWHYIRAHKRDFEVAGMPVALKTRLCEDPSEPISPDDWDVPDYLSIMAYSGRNVNEDDATALVCRHLRGKAQESLWTGIPSSYLCDPRVRFPDILDLDGMRRIIWHLAHLGLAGTLSVCNAIDKSLNLRLICADEDFGLVSRGMNDNPLEQRRRMWKVFCQSIVSDEQIPICHE